MTGSKPQLEKSFRAWRKREERFRKVCVDFKLHEYQIRMLDLLRKKTSPIIMSYGRRVGFSTFQRAALAYGMSILSVPPGMAGVNSHRSEHGSAFVFDEVTELKPLQKRYVVPEPQRKHDARNLR